MLRYLAILLFCVIAVHLSAGESRRYLKVVDVYERRRRSVEPSDERRAELIQHHIRLLKKCSTSDPPSPDYVENIRRMLFCDATNCKDPMAIFLGGGSASGKSEIDDKWAGMYDKKCGIVHIDPDAIMMELPEWDRMQNSSDANCTAAVLYDNAGHLAQQFYDEAITLRRNVVFDCTMSKWERTASQIYRARDNGYDLRMIGVTSNISIAAQRSLQRGHETGRYVPLCAIVDTHVGYSQNFERYAELIPKHQLYDSTNYDSIPVRIDGQIKNHVLYRRFLAKRDATADSVEDQLPEAMEEEYEELDEHCGICGEGRNTTLIIVLAVLFAVLLLAILLGVLLCLYRRRTHARRIPVEERYAQFEPVPLIAATDDLLKVKAKPKEMQTITIVTKEEYVVKQPAVPVEDYSRFRSPTITSEAPVREIEFESVKLIKQ